MFWTTSNPHPLFQPGDKVTCVDDDHLPPDRQGVIKCGESYTVFSVDRHNMLVLEGNPVNRFYWADYRFRRKMMVEDEGVKPEFGKAWSVEAKRLNCRVGTDPLTEEEMRRRAMSQYLYDDAQVPAIEKRVRALEAKYDAVEAEIREIGRAAVKSKPPTYGDFARVVEEAYIRTHPPGPERDRSLSERASEAVDACFGNTTNINREMVVELVYELMRQLEEARKLLGHNFERREADKFSINKNRQEPE